MTKSTKATQAAPATLETPELEVYGVEDYWKPHGKAAFLDDRALSAVSAALAAISTCADILNSREVDRGDSKPAPCPLVTHGLLAAISTCADMVKMTLGTETAASEAVILSGTYAKAVERAAMGAQVKAHMEGAK